MVKQNSQKYLYWHLTFLLLIFVLLFLTCNLSLLISDIKASWRWKGMFTERSSNTSIYWGCNKRYLPVLQDHLSQQITQKYHNVTYTPFCLGFQNNNDHSTLSLQQNKSTNKPRQSQTLSSLKIEDCNVHFCTDWCLSSNNAKWRNKRQHGNQADPSAARATGAGEINTMGAMLTHEIHGSSMTRNTLCQGQHPVMKKSK